MSAFNCGYCGNSNTLTESKFNIRLQQSKSGILYCNPQCNAKGRKLLNLVAGLPITLNPNSEWPGIFSGGSVNPKKGIGGVELSNYKGETIVTLAEFMAKDGSILSCPVEATEEGNLLILLPPAATTPAPAPPVVVEVPSVPAFTAAGTAIPQRPPAVVQNNPVIPTAGVAVAAPARTGAGTIWQGSLDRTTPLGDCNADMYPGLGKSCNYDEASKIFKWSYVDQATGVLTISPNQCNRCQGKGWISPQNLGYNFRFDAGYNKDMQLINPVRTPHPYVQANGVMTSEPNGWAGYYGDFVAVATKTHPIFGGTPAPVVVVPAVPEQPIIDQNPFG